MKNKKHRVIQLSCVKLLKEPYRISFIVDDDFNEKDFDWDRIIRYESDTSPNELPRSTVDYKCETIYGTREFFDKHRKDRFIGPIGQYMSGYEKVSVVESDPVIDNKTSTYDDIKLKLEKNGNVLGVIYKHYIKYIDGICNHLTYVDGYKGLVEWFTGGKEKDNGTENYFRGIK